MISIIIPTYNRSALLARAILSVLAQTYSDWELIIIDDGSADDTRDIIKEFIRKDRRIKYLYQENRGQGAARNRGINISKGEYIAFLDSDDEWQPEKLEKQVKFMETHSEYDFCYTADKVIFSDVIKRSQIKLYSNSKKNLPFTKLAGIGISVPSSHLYRKNVFNKIGPFDENTDLIGLEDNDWSVRGYFLNGYYLDEPLTIYHNHDNQITKKNVGQDIKKQIRGLRYIFNKNLNLIKKNKIALLFRISQIAHLKIKYYALRIYQ